MSATPKIIVCTAAGRQRYLQLLAQHVLPDPAVAEWHLWYNCRDPNDDAYLQQLALHPKVKLLRREGTNGTNLSVNLFYNDFSEPDTLYIKIDDDVVWTDENFFACFGAEVAARRGRNMWYAPLIINNAICSWLLRHFSKVSIPYPKLSCMANDGLATKTPEFCHFLHLTFLKNLSAGRLDDFRIGNHEVMLSRFSINCIAVFGSDQLALGPQFCPPAEGDEDWISAVLPAKTGKPGIVLGSHVVAHFAFHSQEHYLLKTDVLERYYAAHNMQIDPRLMELARAMPERRGGENMIKDLEDMERIAS